MTEVKGEKYHPVMGRVYWELDFVLEVEGESIFFKSNIVTSYYAKAGSVAILPFDS